MPWPEPIEARPPSPPPNSCMTNRVVDEGRRSRPLLLESPAGALIGRLLIFLVGTSHPLIKARHHTRLRGLTMMTVGIGGPIQITQRQLRTSPPINHSHRVPGGRQVRTNGNKRKGRGGGSPLICQPCAQCSDKRTNQTAAFRRNCA